MHSPPETLWVRCSPGIVRDMDSMGPLLAYGGFAGRLVCVDMEREGESQSGDAGQAFSAAVLDRNVFSVISSVRFAPSAPCLGLTCDAGSFQVRDIRSGAVSGQFRSQWDQLYAHSWVDNVTVTLAHGGCGVVEAVDIRNLSSPLWTVRDPAVKDLCHLAFQPACDKLALWGTDLGVWRLKKHAPSFPSCAALPLAWAKATDRPGATAGGCWLDEQALLTTSESGQVTVHSVW